MEGYAEQKRDVPPPLKPFWNVQNDIHVTDKIPLRDNRLAIPSAWRKDILRKLHISHCGIEKGKALVTDFWQKIFYCLLALKSGYFFPRVVKY